ncbi:MAG: response regulator transcription factor [Armatimonadetes bacterium]|nr:response regulator transcription factor [Armatimonadota bacterium]
MAYSIDQSTLSSLQGDEAPKSFKLTTRELEVLAEIAKGSSSKEAGDALFLSKRTIDFHLSSIFLKLHASNRVHALRVAQDMGLMFEAPTADGHHKRPITLA